MGDVEVPDAGEVQRLVGAGGGGAQEAAGGAVRVAGDHFRELHRLEAQAGTDVGVVLPGHALVAADRDARLAVGVDVAVIERVAVTRGGDRGVHAEVGWQGAAGDEAHVPGGAGIGRDRYRLLALAVVVRQQHRAVGCDLDVAVDAGAAAGGEVVGGGRTVEGKAAGVAARAEAGHVGLRTVVDRAAAVAGIAQRHRRRIRAGADGLVVQRAVGWVELPRDPGLAVVVAVGEQAVGADQQGTGRLAVELRDEGAAGGLVEEQDRVQRGDAGDDVRLVLPVRLAGFRQRRVEVLGEGRAQGLQARDVHRPLGLDVVAHRGLAGGLAQRCRRRVDLIARIGGAGRARRRRRLDRTAAAGFQRDHGRGGGAAAREGLDAHGVGGTAAAGRKFDALRSACQFAGGGDLGTRGVEQREIEIGLLRIPAQGDDELRRGIGAGVVRRQVYRQREVVAGVRHVRATDRHRVGNDEGTGLVTQLGTGDRECSRCRRGRPSGHRHQGEGTEQQGEDGRRSHVVFPRRSFRSYLLGTALSSKR